MVDISLFEFLITILFFIIPINRRYFKILVIIRFLRRPSRIPIRLQFLKQSICQGIVSNGNKYWVINSRITKNRNIHQMKMIGDP